MLHHKPDGLREAIAGAMGTTMLGTAEMIPKIGDFAKIGTDLLASSIILAAKTQRGFPREVDAQVV